MKTRLYTHATAALIIATAIAGAHANAAFYDKAQIIEMRGNTRQELDFSILKMREQTDLECTSRPRAFISERLLRYKIERATNGGGGPLYATGYLTIACLHQ
jgi:hypothetical protein